MSEFNKLQFRWRAGGKRSGGALIANSVESGQFLVGLLDPQIGLAVFGMCFRDPAVHFGDLGAHLKHGELLGELGELRGLGRGYCDLSKITWAEASRLRAHCAGLKPGLSLT